MENLDFSQAQANDISEITGILTEATHYKLRKDDNSWGETGWYEHEIQDRIGEGSTFYIIKHKDEVIGTVSLAWQDERNWGEKSDDAGYVHQLAVKDAYHGKGIGKQIIDWLSGEVARRNRHFLRLDCDLNNTRLCSYYEKQGFVRVDTSKRADNEMGTYEAALYERPVQYRN